MCLSVLLRCMGLPQFIAQSDLPGPHAVSFVRERVALPRTSSQPVASVLCLVVYPSAPKDASKRPSAAAFEPYWRDGAVAGIAAYSHTPAWVFRHLSASAHPCSPPHEDPAPPPPSTHARGWPVVVFSHGLAGCADMYVQLCRCLASFGYVVVALEHEDRSGCFATAPPAVVGTAGEVLAYLSPDDTPYSRAKVLDFRAPFLARRMSEMRGVLAALNAPLAEGSEALRAAWAAADGGTVHLVGHSFGGATVALTAQELRLEGGGGGGVGGGPSKCQVRSVAMLDAWAFCLPDDALDRGTGGLPTLSVLSEAWTTKDEKPQVTGAQHPQGAPAGCRALPPFLVAPTCPQTPPNTRGLRCNKRECCVRFVGACRWTSCFALARGPRASSCRGPSTRASRTRRSGTAGLSREALKHKSTLLYSMLRRCLRQSLLCHISRPV